MRIFKPLTVMLAMIPLLGSCSLFQPNEKVIEYDEEVKLHDESMIWVHIKRHYVLAGGGALGDPGAFKKGYVPKEVEISWDTGFPNVGRKSVFFDHVVEIIANFDNKWFVGGIASKNQNTLDETINCLKVGNKIGYDGCILVIDMNGNYIKPSLDYMNKFYQKNYANLLSPYSIEYIEIPPNFINGKKLTWEEKLNLQKARLEEGQLINKQLFKSGVVNYE